MRILYILTALCLLSVPFYAQNVSVNGVVLNAETNEPVEFANIGIEGTYLGAATSFEGKFQIDLSPSLEESIIRISAVGYQPKTFSVGDWLNQSELKVFLAPANYGLSEIDIKADSKVAYGIIRTASNLIQENYPQNAFAIECVYSDNGGPARDSESVQTVSVYDASGYTNRTYTDAYNNRNYSFTKNNSESASNSLKEGMNWMEQILTGDVARVTGNILSVETINDFKIEIKEEKLVGQDSVWVITYDCINPTIANTGNADVLKYAGIITISQNSYAVISNAYSVTRSKSLVHGNSFNTPEVEVGDTVSYSVEVNYSKDGAYYLLSSITYKQGSKKASLDVKNLVTFDPLVKNHQYYSGINY